MESSSGDSFTWTDTSSDSLDSHSMAPAVSVLDNSTESDKKRRKRKLKELSDSISNGGEDAYEEKMKIKVEKEQSYVEKVKLEPVSDSDVPKKKKKIKHIEVNGHQHDLQESASYDESYLDFRVKQEKLAAESSGNKIKKKRKHSGIDESDLQTEKLKHRDNNSDKEENNSQYKTSSSKSKKKKKKSKKRSESESQHEMDIDNKKHIEELDKHSPNHKPQYNTTSRFTHNSLTENTFQDETGCDEISAIQCDDDHNLHTISFGEGQTIEKESKKKNESLYKSTILNQFKMDTNYVSQDSLTTVAAAEKRTPRISDRIRFEDEDDPETEFDQTYENKPEKTSSKLRKFVKSNNHMKLVSQELHHSSILSHDDEIWIVKCPKEVDIQAFYDTDLNIQGKCKVKVGGQTYDGNLEDEQCNTIATLSMEHSKYEIENLPLCGLINFRKRIPKAHFREDNVMINNQTNFIPLPETKCRHPLFGSNYKKALKIPTAVAERLNPQNREEEAVTIEKRKKKKHKKDKSLQESEEIDGKREFSIMKSEPTIDVPEKKKKKRKHASDDGPAPKRVKRIKHDPESAEAWESEKAIEENLFNF